MSEPSFVAETLAWCNEMRATKGMEPLDVLPKGRRYDGASCPCGKATGLHVTTNALYENTEGIPLLLGPIPKSVAVFVKSFDAGRLPQYDEKLSDEGHYFDAEGNSAPLDEALS